MDRQGRKFNEAYRYSPHLAVHAWQDLQSILSAFCRIATDSILYGAATRGEPVALSNYRSACDLADSLTSDLRAILNGNGLGKFEGTPNCALWFAAALPVVSPLGPAQRPTGPSAGGDTKRQKTQDAPPSDRNKKPATDQADQDRKRLLGLLVFDSAVAGTNRLPTINVYHKARNAKTPERLCMKFLTRGYVCDRADCKLPHISGVDTLPSAERTKFIEFVKKQPGISWAEGKAPAGTS